MKLFYVEPVTNGMGDHLRVTTIIIVTPGQFLPCHNREALTRVHTRFIW